MNRRIDLPAQVAPGPTKPEIRAIAIHKLVLRPTDHFVDVGSGSGAVAIEAAEIVNRVTAIERDPDRVQAIQKNVRANDVEAVVDVKAGEAPEQLPEAGDVMFIGGTQRLPSVLDEIRPIGIDRVLLNAARIQTATKAIEAFEERNLLTDVLTLRIDRGYQLGDGTGFKSDNPVFMVVGSTESAGEGINDGDTR